MKRTLTRLLIATCLFCAGSLNLMAQENKPVSGEVVVKKSRPVYALRDEGTFKVLSSKFASSKVVKGAPYSATATTEHVQTLGDGNRIVRKNESKLYRDSEGRTRIEQTLETIGKWTADGQAPQRIFINDPVAGISYSIDPRTRITSFSLKKKGDPQKINHISVSEPLKRDRPDEAAKQLLDHQVQELTDRTRALVEERAEKIDKRIGQKKTESLANQTIGGVTAEGTRSTLTIPAGEIGNTLPLDIVDETWYSPELQITVMTRHLDPRAGETIYRLNNIKRSEPDRSLFDIPDDSTVRGYKLRRRPKPIK